MKYKTVIFDLDGTLLNTLEDLYLSVNYALAAHNHPLRTIDEIRRFIGNGVAVLIRRSAPAGTSEEEAEALLDIFREHYLAHMNDHTCPYDGIMDMLSQLEKAGIRTAIVSNKVDKATKELNAMYFAPQITVAIGAPPDKKKPHPASVFTAMEELHAVPSETVYVGDSDVDVETAGNAGIDCIGVSWGYRGREFLANLGLKMIADTPEDLLTLLNEA